MPYLPPPQPPDTIVAGQLLINQGATFRQTFACDLSYYGIPNIGMWAVSGGTFALSTGLRGESQAVPVCFGSVFVSGNYVTLDIDESVTDAIRHLNGRFVVTVSDGVDTWRVIEGGWRLNRATDGSTSAVEVIAQPTDYTALLASLSPRGPLESSDIGGVKILGQGFGKWTVGSYAAGTVTSPEVLSVLYRTRVNISWIGAEVGVMVANDIVDAGGAWSARIVSINYIAKTAVLSLWTGTAADAAIITSGGNSIALVSVGAFAGAVTGYQPTVTAGVFAPRAPAPGGIYNAVGSVQDSALGYRFPYMPEYYDRQFTLPPDEMGQGAVLEVIYSGTIKNTIPAGDNARLELTLAMTSTIFREAELDVDRAVWLRCETDVLPAIAVETPVQIRLRLQSGRRSGFTQYQTLLAVAEGAGFRVAGTSSGTLDLEALTASDRNNLNVGLWIAASPEFQSGAGDFHLNVTEWLAQLVGEVQ